MLLALLLAAGFVPFNPAILPRSTTVTPGNLFLLSGAAQRPAVTDPAYRTPLTVLALPPYTLAGQVAGLRVDVSSWITPTPAAGDLVGALIRVANEGRLQDVPGMWALDVLALHQGGAPPAGALARGLEVEIGHQEADAARIETDPWAGFVPDHLRVNGLEVHLQGNSPGPGTAAMMVDSAYFNPEPTAKWRYGLAVRGVKEAALLDTSATWTLLVERGRVPAWGLGVSPDGAYLTLQDVRRGQPGLTLGAGRAWLWMGGALRPVEVGEPNSGGPGWRMVRTPN